jgi:hypothetical protein
MPSESATSGTGFTRDGPATQGPAVIRRVRVATHECVLDDITTRIDLGMCLALVVIPDPPAAPGEHGSDGQERRHLPRLEDPALRLVRGIRSPPKSKPPAIGGIENAASKGSESVDLIESQLA